MLLLLLRNDRLYLLRDDSLLLLRQLQLRWRLLSPPLTVLLRISLSVGAGYHGV